MSATPLTDPDVLQELQFLRHDYRCALSVSCDPEEKYRLYRLIQELNACIERMQRAGVQLRIHVVGKNDAR